MGDRTASRTGAVSVRGAAIGLFMVNVFPHTTREDGVDAAANLRAPATNDWTFVQLVSYLPLLLLVPWVFALCNQHWQSSDESRSAIVAKFAWGVFILGEAVYLVRLAIHGPILHQAAVAWVGGGASDAAVDLIGRLVLALDGSLTGISLVVSWSSGALPGLVVVLGSTYPRVLGWLLLASGSITVAGVGVPYLAVGPTPIASAISVFVASPAILLIFPFVALMWRAEGRGAVALEIEASGP